MVIASLPLVLAWDFEPVYLVPLVAVTVMYLALVGPLRTRWWPDATIKRAQVVSFLSGMGALAIALLSPLNLIAMVFLLTAHMVQHVIFTVVAPPLLLLGIPGWLVEPLFRSPKAQWVGRWLTYPVVAFGLYNLNMWMWHVPALLDATPPSGVFALTRLLDVALVIAALFGLLFIGPTFASALRLRLRHSETRGQGVLIIAISVLAIGALVVSALTLAPTPPAWAAASQPHNPLHTFMDALFIITALLYWCPILNPVPQLRRISPLFGMLYLFMSTQPMMALGAMMVLASHPIYSLYATAPRISGLTPLADQQLGGLIMWLIMDIPLLIGISILFFRWVRTHERDTGQLTPEEELIWAQQQAQYQNHSRLATEQPDAHD